MVGEGQQHNSYLGIPPLPNPRKEPKLCSSDADTSVDTDEEHHLFHPCLSSSTCKMGHPTNTVSSGVKWKCRLLLLFTHFKHFLLLIAQLYNLSGFGASAFVKGFIIG